MRWKLYEPSAFPASWHDAMQEGVGKDKVCERFHTHHAAKSAQKKFQLFRFSLRNYPLHASSKVHEALMHRTKVSFNRDFKRWELLLTSRLALQDDPELIQVLEIELDSYERLI